ncbi:hypothetical protein ABT187_14300 [Streptomyces sp. NPDC001817]|uniref:LysR family transcriptional regulator substrate-binding protein n=1 Tax=Streptomyces sp. NPDC001817 TaxID=3154398 RepID=UPI00331EEA71
MLDDPLDLAVPKPADAVDADGPTAALRSLAGHPWVMEPEGTAARHWAMTLCRNARFEPDVRFETTHLLLHQRLVEQEHAAASSGADSPRPSPCGNSPAAGARAASSPSYAKAAAGTPPSSRAAKPSAARSPSAATRRRTAQLGVGYCALVRTVMNGPRPPRRPAQEHVLSRWEAPMSSPSWSPARRCAPRFGTRFTGGVQLWRSPRCLTGSRARQGRRARERGRSWDGARAA